MKGRLKREQNRKGRYMIKDQLCPWCYQEVDTFPVGKEFDCPRCANRVVQEFDEYFNGEDVLLKYWLEKVTDLA